jgi:hypothetical protein
MKQRISYNYISAAMPPTPGCGSYQIYKYTFKMKCVSKSIDECVDLELDFGPKAEVKNFVSHERDIGIKQKKNQAFVSIAKANVDQLIGFDLFVLNDGQNHDVKLQCSSGVVLNKADEIVIDAVDKRIEELPVEYPFLIASALQEELTPFLKGKHYSYLENEPHAKVFSIVSATGKLYNVIAYSIVQCSSPYKAY